MELDLDESDAMYNDVCMRMVRKQVYVSQDQDARLKRVSKELGVTESELIRRGVDATCTTVKGPRDPKAWAEFMALAEERARIKAAQVARGWTRDDLYEDD